MKTNLMIVMVAVLTTLSSGCQTAPMTAKTTLAPMPKVNPLTSVKRTTEVTGTTTNITMVETIESPEQGQFELKNAELEGRTKVGVAKAKAKSSGGFWGWLATPAYPSYYGGNGYYGTSYGYSGGGYYGGGVTTGCGEGGRNVIYSTPGGYSTSSPQYQGGNNYVYGGRH